MNTKIKIPKPACINCITLPICRAYVADNPEHIPTDDSGMLIRFLIRKCKPMLNYIYVQSEWVYTASEDKWEKMPTCCGKRLTLLYKYYQTLDEGIYND